LGGRGVEGVTGVPGGHDKGMAPAIDGLDHLVLTVADLAATVAFYTDVLGMREEVFRPADGTTRVALCFGVQKINLHLAGEEFEPKADRPAPGSADLCFLSAAPLQSWQAHLADLGVTIEEGPVRRTGATGPLVSIYVRDPDRNLIEISNRVAQAPT
jgi:catechol 2,3-dioxygenase-like lactoylglutathione lyase family enzyme